MRKKSMTTQIVEPPRQKKAKFRFDTLALHDGHLLSQTGCIASPIYQSVSYPFPSADYAEKLFSMEVRGHMYARTDNPTNSIFEKRLAALEGGEACLSTSSGMAAIYMVYIHLVKHGDEIVSSNKVYGGTNQLNTVTMPKMGVKAHKIDDPGDLDAWKSAINEKTKFLLIETPSNPALHVSDIKALSELAHNNDIPLVVDNTIASPALQRPLDLGADIIVHSASKYICGNSTALGGAIIGTEELVEETIRGGEFRNIGPSMAPFNAWLMILGLETLSLRMEKHSSNALRVAKFLEEHSMVESVNYPGLVSHPQYELTRNQMPKGSSSLLSWNIRGDKTTAHNFIDSVKLFACSAHLGTSKSLTIHPATTSHQQVEPEERLAVGIPDNLIRMSVGIEDPEDLIDDLHQAFSMI